MLLLMLRHQPSAATSSRRLVGIYKTHDVTKSGKAAFWFY